MAEELRPARHVVPPPENGWAAADLSDDELVDDEFIDEHCDRVFEPLQPDDEKLFPVEIERED